MYVIMILVRGSGVTRGGGRIVPGDTLQEGDTQRKNFCGQIYRE